MNKKNKNLAINGGKPVSENAIMIHKPILDDDDLNGVLRIVI